MLNFSGAGENHAWDDELNYTKKTTPNPQKNHDISPSQTKGKQQQKQNCPSFVEPPVKTPGGGGSPTFKDADGDGFLYSTELKNFAAEMGFEGNDSEWNQEKKSTNPPFCWVKLGQVLRFPSGGLGVGGEM